MKKTFLLFVACLMASVVSGQTPYVIFDGEDETNPWWSIGGANVDVFNWAGNASYGATIWRVDENDAWAGGGITLDLDISEYNKIAIDVLKQVEGTVQIELRDGDERSFM